MILPTLVLSATVDKKLNYLGMDSSKYCVDKKHFQNYPYKVEYVFNGRGFRDSEWPQDLDDAIWCFGDSFTVGVGVPYEHSWPQVLSKLTGRRTINISMSGASNNWIARKITELSRELQPSTVVIHWSYINRRENDLINLSDEDRRLHFITASTTDPDDDVENTIKCIDLVQQSLCDGNVIHSVVPDFAPDKDRVVSYFKKNNLKFVEPFDRLDFARDGHHYDIKTAEYHCNEIIKLL